MQMQWTKKRRNLLLLALAAVTATIGAPQLARSPLGGLPGELAELPQEAADATVRLAAAAKSTGSHLGFDTNGYPGDETMRLWKDEGTYEWVGYYLPAPCHKDTTWSGKRQTLVDMGWGMAVIYVGQQTWGKVPGKAQMVTRYVPKRVRESYRTKSGKKRTRTVTKRVPVRTVVQPRAEPGQTCSTQHVSASRGVLEAQDAIARTQREGFPRGSVIFLDVEYMDQVPQRMRDYYTSWVRAVLADGRYRPGIYTHTHNAPIVYKDVKAVYVAANEEDEPPFWIAGSPSKFDPTKLPTDVGHTFAAVWQGILDKVEERAGVKLPIDVNVSAHPDPSSSTVAD